MDGADVLFAVFTAGVAETVASSSLSVESELLPELLLLPLLDTLLLLELKLDVAAAASSLLTVDTTCVSGENGTSGAVGVLLVEEAADDLRGGRTRLWR